MWALGAFIGGLLGYVVHRDAWPVGVIVGAVFGWVVSRVVGGAQGGDRLAEIESRLGLLQDRFDAFDRRLGRLQDRFDAFDRRLGRLEGERPRPSAVEAPEPEPVATGAEAAMPAAAEAALREPAALPSTRLLSRGLEESPVWRWLAGGNTVVRVGVVILFFGVAFLLKYAQEHVHAPIELRLAGVAAGATVLLVVGWRLRERHPGYALSLQGGGIGLLYLAIFAAFRLYGLLPPAAAFALLVGVAALSAVIAIAQDARSLAVLGVSGGFLAPILASTGGGSHVMLFSYYAVLNASILAIAWFKAWRLLNLLGFAFTFAIGTTWGFAFYRPEHFASTEPFLIFFFLVYVAVPILFARHQARGLERYVDATLVFGVPLVAFGLQVGLVREIEYGASWSALPLAAVYLVLARGVFARVGEAGQLLAEAFLSLGVVFGTLTIPLALHGRWTSAAWALEGAAIVWIGIRQRRRPARLFGIALQFLAGIAFLADLTEPGGPLPVANSVYLGCAFLAVAGLFCAWYLDRHRGAVTAAERTVAPFLFAWGIVWWVGGGLHDIGRHVAGAYRVQAALLFFTGSCVAFGWLRTRLPWPRARYPAQALLPLMVAAAAASTLETRHPFAHLGYVAWPLAFAAHLLLLRRHEVEASRYQYWIHAAGLWLLTALGSWEVGWGIDNFIAGRAVWPIIAWALVPGALLVGLALRGMRISWPVAAHREAYLLAGAAPLAVFLGLWTFLVNFVSSGDPSPLPYVPILNPLDLVELGAVLAVGLWFVEVRRLGLHPLATAPLTPVYGLLAATTFVWVNAVLLRTLHHWAGVPFDLEGMLRSDLVQTALSIFWTLLAVGGMVLATRYSVRVTWLAGAGLMAIVVAKLFLIDLSSFGTVQRIVSFIGVGVLMLIVGYFSPVPPRAGGGSRMTFLIAAILLAPVLAAAEQPRDFAYGIPLQTSGQDALFQIEVPRAVYEGVVRADLGDARVFNGAGEVVPHAFRPRITATTEKRQPVAVPLFPIRTDAPAGVEGVDLHLERRGNQTVIDLRTRDGKPAGGTRLVGYLADLRTLDTPIRAIELKLPAGAEEVVTRVTIESSDDLRQWATLASGAAVMKLSSGGQRLEQLRIEIAARKSKYLRVSWPGRSRTVDLSGLLVEPGEETVEVPRQWKPVTGAPAKDKPGEHEFDLGGQFPVDRLRVRLPQPNTVASVEILSRSKSAEPWRRVTTATVYRLFRDGDELTSAEISVGLNADRYWLAKVDQRGGGIGGGPLALSAGWVPHRLVFAARGAGPFQLAYGSRDAKPTAFPIATLVPGEKGEEELALKQAEVRTAAPQKLGGEAATRERFDWKRWTMWGSLVLGVAMVGWMAIRLGRQMFIDQRRR